MDIISNEWMIGVGILLLGLEILTLTFYFFWFALGFMIVGGVGYVYTFSNGYEQLAAASVVGLILLFALRGFIKRSLDKTPDTVEDTPLGGGKGVVFEGIIKLNGTSYSTLSDLSSYTDGDIVDVLEIKNNKAILKTDS